MDATCFRARLKQRTLDIYCNLKVFSIIIYVFTLAAVSEPAGDIYRFSLLLCTPIYWLWILLHYATVTYGGKLLATLRWQKREVKLLYEETRVLARKAEPFVRVNVMGKSASPFAGLPNEIVFKILNLAAFDNKDDITWAPAYNHAPMFVNRACRLELQPRYYTSLYVSTTTQFNALRHLIFENRVLGTHVQRLAVVSTKFDDRNGCSTEPLADPEDLSDGIEQLLIMMPNVQHLCLDLFGMSALYKGSYNNRFSSSEKGPKIKSLKCELPFIRFIDLPMFESLEDLELVCFYFDPKRARELRAILPHLKRLTIRLVREGSAADGSPAQRLRETFGRRPEGHDADDEVTQSTSMWSDTPTGKKQAEEFTEALKLLRSWQQESPNVSWTRLESVTVLTWPAACRDLQHHFGLLAGVERPELPDPAANPPAAPMGFVAAAQAEAEENDEENGGNFFTRQYRRLNPPSATRTHFAPEQECIDVVRHPSDLASAVRAQNAHLASHGIPSHSCHLSISNSINKSTPRPTPQPRPVRRFDEEALPPQPLIVARPLAIRSDVTTHTYDGTGRWNWDLTDEQRAGHVGGGGFGVGEELDAKRLGYRVDLPLFVEGDEGRPAGTVLRACPVRIDLNGYQRFGPRKGGLRAWFEDA